MDQPGARVLDPGRDAQARLEQRVARRRADLVGERPPHEPGTARPRLGVREARQHAALARRAVGLDDARRRRRAGDDRQRALGERGLHALDGGRDEVRHPDAGEPAHALHAMTPPP